MIDPRPHHNHTPFEPSRLDLPICSRAALARSLDRLLAGTALQPATETTSRCLARTDGLDQADRTWRASDRHARATTRRTQSSEIEAFLDAAQASVQLRADLLIDPDEHP